MNSIELTPMKIQGIINAPPSKAITLRKLFISALSKGKTIIKNPLLGEDQKHAINALKKMNVEIIQKKNSIEINNSKKLINPKKIFIGNSGVSMRFLVPITSLAEKNTVIYGNKHMNKRPIGELIKTVNELNGEAVSVKKNNCPPLKIKGKKLIGGKTKIDCSKSSQYLSALLISAPLTEKGMKIKAKNISSKPFIELTLSEMKKTGIKIQNKKFKEFIIKGKQKYKIKNETIEGDWTNASYFMAAAAITKGKITINNLNKNSLQGDKIIIEILKKMGAKIIQKKNSITIKGNKLKGININMNNYPDLVPTIAILAACAKGKTLIKNINHLKFKETNRIKAIITELKKTGIKSKQNKKIKGIEIIGGKINSTTIETYDDHRIAMAFSLLSLKTKMKIKNPKCVKKSFPNFFTEFNKIRKKNEKNIVLIGFRGTGKTTLGKIIAKKMNRKFIDSDELIEKKTRKKIYEIFKEKGEKYFRKKEKQIIELISKQKNKVISCGGGVILKKENIKNLKKNGFIILLTASEKTLIKRNKNSKRPALTKKKLSEEIKELLKKRKKIYLKTMNAKINTDKLNKEKASEKGIELFLKSDLNE